MERVLARMYPDPGSALPQRIFDLYGQLSRAERRLADMLLENFDLLPLHNASQLSAKAGVSKATTARFFRRLGYASFKTAQRSARTAEGWADAKVPHLARTEAEAPLELSRHLTAEVQNLVRTVEALRSDELAPRCRPGPRRQALGRRLRRQLSLAHFARALLIRVKADIRMIPIGGFSMPEEFASIQPTDAMLALGVGRKTRSLRSRSCARRSRAGAQVVLVTDQATRAGPDVATVTLRCRTKGSGVFDSVVAPVSLLTYLCSALALRIGQARDRPAALHRGDPRGVGRRPAGRHLSTQQACALRPRHRDKTNAILKISCCHF